MVFDKVRIMKYALSDFFQENRFPLSVVKISTKGTKWSEKRLYYEPRFPDDYHSHEFAELVIVEEGTIDHYSTSKKTRLKKGDFFLIPPNVLHTYSNTNTNTVYYNLIYDPTAPIPMLMTLNQGFIQKLYLLTTENNDKSDIEIFHLPEKVLVGIIPSIKKIDDENRKQKPGSHLLIMALFIEIVVTLARYCKDTLASDPEWELKQAIAYIKSHYHEKIKISQLAKRTNMSESTLFRRFQSSFGISPNDYLMDYRVKQAILMIRNGNSSLEQIACSCGFYNGSHLRRIMRQRLKTTPKEIRDKSRNA